MRIKTIIRLCAAMLLVAAGISVVSAGAADDTAAATAELYKKRFDFGEKGAEEGSIEITSSTRYSDKTGYGLEDNLALTPGGASAESDYLMAKNVKSGITFTADVPDGDYKVTVVCGADKATRSNIYINGGERVRVFTLAEREFKSQEQAVVPNKGRITIQVIGAPKAEGEKETLYPSVSSIEIEQLPARTEKRDIPALYIAGDSTAQTYNHDKEYPQTGWGQVAADYFDKSKIEIINRSIGGRSLKSYNNDGRLDRILTEMHPGDYVYIQFGHNDGSSKPERYISVEDYEKLLKNKYIKEIQKRGGYPVILTPTPHYSPDDNGIFAETIIDYSNASRYVAEEMNVPLIDIQKNAVEEWNTLGAAAVKRFYFINEKDESVKYPDGTDDHTHFKEAGARRIAMLVAEGTAEKVPELAESVYTKESPRVFEDIKDHWAEEYINSISADCIVNGRSQTEFDPESSVSRAEFLAMAMRLYGINGKAYRGEDKTVERDGESIVLKAVYSDVAADSWYKFYVQSAQDKEIIPASMVTDGKFNPDKPITRAEAACVMQLCADYAKAMYKTTRNIPVFDDFNAIDKETLSSVMFVLNSGIMNGMNDEEFAPNGTLTRAQAATIICRARDLKV